MRGLFGNIMFEHFDWSIRFGDVLTMAGAVFVGGSFLYRRGGRDATLDTLAKDFTEMKEEFKTFAQTLSKVAIQEMQISLLMKWYDELRRGIGKIEP